MLDDQAISSLGFPVILSKKLKERTDRLNQGTNTISKSMDVEKPQPAKAPQSQHNKMEEEYGQSESEKLAALLNHIYSTVLGTDNVINVLHMLYTFLNNVVEKPQEMKYRVINMSKEVIAKSIGGSQYALEILKLARFSPNQDGNYELNGDVAPFMSQLKAIVRQIHDFADSTGK